MEVVGTAPSVIQKIISELQRPELKEIFSMYGYESELEKLQKTVECIEVVLRDAETMQKLSLEAEEWIENLKDVVFRADDLLDEFVTLAEQKNHEKAGSSFDLFNSMFKEVEKVGKILDEFASNRHHQYMKKFCDEPIMNISYKSRSYADVDDIVGREYDLEDIVGKLLDSDVQNDVSFLTILGTRGIGKTALARLVYNDKRVKNAFSLRLWSCVSDQDPEVAYFRFFDRNILACCTDWNPIISSLYDFQKLDSKAVLSHEKYLLILDDVRTENHHQFDLELASFFKSDKKGSWIVVTTRSREIANTLHFGSTYTLEGLSENDSWSLFEKVAYDSEHSYRDGDFFKIGEYIVGKCYGVPLALRVAGSLVYGQDKNTWQAVSVKLGEADDNIIIKDDDGISQLLKLSYQFLPSTLKSCFSYCAIFPKNYRTEKNTLISLWMAQNYIVRLYEGQSIEDAGEKYFSILLWRCFFHDIKKDDETGEVLSVKMHDLLHDIAQYVSRNEIFAVTSISRPMLDHRRVRHLSISNSSKRSIIPLVSTHIRSYIEIFEDLENEGELPYVETLVDSCRFLRTLKLKSKYLPSSIGRLLHLRYLNLAYNFSLEVLPSSITELFNLETLILTNCTNLEELPKDLSRLTKLRVLDISRCYRLKVLLSSITELCNLETLILIGSDLKELPKDLSRLTKLRVLDISRSYKLKVLPSSITELCNLETLILTNCSDLKELPKDLSRLTKLRVLDISQCHRLEYMPKNMSKLTCIKRLSDFIVGGEESYSSWREWFLGLEELKDLNKLEGALNIKIRFPTYVRNFSQKVPDQQKGMYLRDKNDLIRIAIKFEHYYRSVLDDAETIKLMEDLQAPPNLQALHVYGYYGTRMPKWISRFPCLVTLQLQSCMKLEYLETSGNGDGIFLPNLQTLELLNMLKFKGWSRGGVGVGVGVEESSNSQLHLLSSLPRLENLVIEKCPELMCIPLCHEVEIVFESPKLRYVRIDDVAWLNSLPTEAFQCLETLEILKDGKVKNLGEVEKVFRACSSSLRFLKISFCCELRSVFVGGLEHLSALETLEISNCMELEPSEQIEHPSFLPSLHTLRLEYLPAMLDLPDWMQFLPTIQTLKIRSCMNLKAMPNWMSKLTSLKQLEVRLCSKRLEKRCKIQGQDWPFIQHIPTINFYSTFDYETDDETNTSTVESIPQLDGKSLPKKTEELKLHCSIFPSAYEFEREKLIQLWMAVGFFEEEEVGNINFDVLVEQNCILLARTDILTGKNKYKVDLDKITSAFNGFRSIKNEHLNAILEDDQNMAEDESKFRHISLVSDHIDQTVFEGLKKFRELRTLLFTRNYGSSLKQVPSDMFIALQSLQALDLSGSHLVELPSSIGNLVFLRYLDLSFTLIKSLPESIDCLRELQTLKLEGCKHIYKLPNGMKELIKLRYLELDVLGQLTYMPKEIGKLIELRTLSAFIVESEEGCSIRELKNMNNLRGHFCISGLENASSEEIEQANIKDKIHITRLQLRWNDSHCVEGCDDYSSIVDHLMPNCHLEELQILHYPAQKLPKWIGFSVFVKLVSIVFIDCAIEELNITLGMLPNLKHVQIIQMNRLVVINQGIHNSCDGSRGIFPKLETLSIEGMSSLECWRDTKDGDFPLLSKLIIEQCPKLTELPFLPYLPSLNYLKISDCTSFQALPKDKLSSSLQTLAIDDCPLLEKRCNKECEDWHKIEHVLNILINMNDVRSEHEEEPRSDSDSDDYEDLNGQIQLDNH